jgi:hypothetical protein
MLCVGERHIHAHLSYFPQQDAVDVQLQPWRELRDTTSCRRSRLGTKGAMHNDA